MGTDHYLDVSSRFEVIDIAHITVNAIQEIDILFSDIFQFHHAFNIDRTSPRLAYLATLISRR